jgi:SAM-dependent methyltransferase
LVRGSLMALPFRTGTFDCVICSQVIEHVEKDPVLFSELARVLRIGGRLVLGTPDYATIAWRVIEPLYGWAAPGGYKGEHISHYTLAGLLELLPRHGFEVLEHAYVARSELIIRARKCADRSQAPIR